MDKKWKLLRVISKHNAYKNMIKFPCVIPSMEAKAFWIDGSFNI